MARLSATAIPTMLQGVVSDNEPAAAETARMRRNALAVALAVVGLLLIGGAAFAWYGYTRTWEAAEDQAAGLAERHAVLLSFLLDDVRSALEERPGGLGGNAGRRTASTTDDAALRAEIYQLDADGRLLNARREALLPPGERWEQALQRARSQPGRPIFTMPHEVEGELWSWGMAASPAEPPAFYATPFRVDQVIGLWDQLETLDSLVVLVIDAADRLWIRYPYMREGQGNPLPNLDLGAASGAEARGSTQWRGLDGVERLFAWQRTVEGGMVVAVGVPLAEVRSQWLERFLPTLLVIVALACAAILALWSYGRSVLAYVSQREAALLALGESESRFRDFADASSDWFWETDAGHRFTWLSERVGELFDAPGKSFIGKLRTELMEAPADDEHYRRHLADLEAQRPFRDFVYRARLNGRRHWVKISGKPVFAKDGSFLGYRGTGSDIDAQRVAEERAETLHRRLEEAFEASLDAVALFDPDHRLILANERYKEFFFSDCRELVQPGLHFREVVERLTRMGRQPSMTRRDELWRVLGTRERSGTQNMTFEVPDGRWIRLRERVTARGDYFRVFSDVTEFKRREEELRHTKEAAELANRSKSEFLAVMSHELRTPLNAIIGFSDILRSEMFGPLGSPRYREYSADINQSGRHLLELINDILDISKAEAGKLELQEEVVSLEDLAARALAMIVPRAEEAGVALALQLPKETVRLRADRRKLLQMLLNLLSNAVKFTRRDGRVTLAASVGPEGLELRVEDTGIGIAPQDLARVQEPFIQLDPALTRQREGTGLGLPLAKRLAELHGGGLEIESEAGVGTKVRVRLPLSRLAGAEITGVTGDG